MRWWSGSTWTEHVAVPEAQAAPEQAPQRGRILELAPTFHDLVQVERAVLADDGLLHPRSKDQVFEGAPRGPVTAPSERALLDRDALLGLTGMQLLGAAAVTLLCWWFAIVGSLDGAGGWESVRNGAGLAFGVLIPIATVGVLRVQRRSTFWWTWCASRGFQPGLSFGRDSILPPSLGRSPLLGSVEDRIVEHLATRRLAGREAAVGSLMRVLEDPHAERWDLPAAHHAGFVVMQLPPLVAARWAGVSVRADHGARRPMALRAMLGALVPARGPDSHAHLAIAPDQDPHAAAALVDARMERYLTEHPMDFDVVEDLLVVTRDGAPDSCEALDDLCRDALLLHELLVAEHELPVAPVAEAHVGEDDEPVIDLERAGWGEDEVQYYEAA